MVQKSRNKVGNGRISKTNRAKEGIAVVKAGGEKGP